MHCRKSNLRSLVLILAFSSWATSALAQDESRLSLDLGVGIDISVNGNVNSGAIGRLSGQTAAILPNPYGQVYGTGLHFLVGAGWALNDESELRGGFTFQTADANLVRLGDLGPSSLYRTIFGLPDRQSRPGLPAIRRVSNAPRVRLYAEATIGIALIDAIDVQLAAPQSNVILDNTDFYDQSSAFTWGIGGGVMFPIAERMDLNVRMGLKHVSGLAEVDQLVGTGYGRDQQRQRPPHVSHRCGYPVPVLRVCRGGFSKPSPGR